MLHRLLPTGTHKIIIVAMSPKQSLRDATGQAGGVKKKVIVAMSGGVDSSVATALLKRAGFNVVGVFMKFWASPQNRCCSPESEKRARRVAKIIGIPFYVLNFKKEFKKRVVDYFLRGYKEGLTPNPCVVCNKEIKFGLLLEKALALGADYIATGHYARLQRGKLFRARDREKDQSYFLWMLNQKQLRHVLFPVGDYTKKEIRALAKKFKLPFGQVPESMETCFVQTTINDFLSRHIKPKPGRIICAPPGSAHGVHFPEVHRHRGLAFYTIGQRKGIGLSGGPYWVLGKDQKKSILIVTKNEKDLYKKELVCKNVNWISGKEPKLPLKIKAKIRYRHEPALVVITKNLQSKIYSLKFEKPQRAITPGQSVVFYWSGEVLGGGIIM